MIKKLLQPFYTVWVLATFAASVILAFPYFFLVSLGNNFRARAAIHAFIRTWCKGWLWLIGMPASVSGTRPEGRYVIVANHISYMDTLVIFPAIGRYFRPLGKKEFSRYPIIGFIYRQVAILVDRSNAVSRAKSMRLMWRVLRKEGSIIIFPEGTFNETPQPLKNFYDGAFRLSVNTNTPILPLVLPDTPSRWHYSAWWKVWPGRNRAIFLPLVSPEGKDIATLKQEVYDLMEHELEKYQYNKPV